MRRIILSMAVATLVVVSVLFVVSASGRKNIPRPRRRKIRPGFKPAHITVKPGTEVRWINKDSTAHTATANNGKSFDSGRLGPGKRYTHTFKSLGKKSYHCEIHSDMRASVVVKR